MMKCVLRCWVFAASALLLTADARSQEQAVSTWMPAVNEIQSTLGSNTVAANGDLQGIGSKSIDWLSKQIALPTGNTEPGTFQWLSGGASNRSLVKTGATLVLVISLFLLFVFVLRLNRKTGRSALPGDVVAVLGQTQLAPTQRLQLIRLASKILLVSSTQHGSQSLGEVTDPEEVFRIESICRNGKWPGFSQSLRQKAEQQAQQRQQSQAVNEPSNEPARGIGRTLLEA